MASRPLRARRILLAINTSEPSSTRTVRERRKIRLACRPLKRRIGCGESTSGEFDHPLMPVFRATWPDASWATVLLAFLLLYLAVKPSRSSARANDNPDPAILRSAQTASAGIEREKAALSEPCLVSNSGAPAPPDCAKTSRKRLGEDAGVRERGISHDRP